MISRAVGQLCLALFSGLLPLIVLMGIFSGRPKVAEGTLPQEHPTEELWCIPGEFIFVKITVGGYMNARFELDELQYDY